MSMKFKLCTDMELCIVSIVIGHLPYTYRWVDLRFPFWWLVDVLSFWCCFWCCFFLQQVLLHWQ